MKKLIFLLLIIHCTLFIVKAQAPQMFKYQTVVRNSSGNLVVSTKISLRISILEGSSSGTSVYSEQQSPTTNLYGLASVDIGSGTNQTGSFTGIDWSASTYFVKIEADVTGGINFQTVGTSQLLSVPYALYSGTSGSIGITGTTGQTIYNNGKSWLATDNLYNDGSKVGIGTSIPNSILDVNGDISIEGNVFVSDNGRTGNTFLGATGNSTSTGDFNTFIGSQAGKSNTNGAGNHFAGYQAGYTNQAGNYNLCKLKLNSEYSLLCSYCKI